MTKILVVEDDLEIQDLLTFTLENEGYRVISAMDGVEALQKAQTEKPNLIILDVLLPRMNGYEVCEKIRENPLISLTPIIMLTSLTHTKDKITGLKLGADEYITKPFEPNELVARIERLLARVKQDISANPLTGLPGSISVENEIKKLLTEKKKFIVMYLDIDHFKVYNDKYGFQQGDNFIRITAGVLWRALNEADIKNGFIAHIGSEDFVLVLPGDGNVELVAKKIIELFDFAVLTCYDEDVKRRGYIWSKDQQGKDIKMPIASLSIGITIVEPEKYHHHLQVLDQAKQMWRIAKSTPGNTYIIG